MTEDEIRRVLDGLRRQSGEALLEPDDVAEIEIDARRLAVVLGDRFGEPGAVRSSGSAVAILGTAGSAGETVRRVHRALVERFPGVQVEVRAGERIFRGGAGFGVGRHVVAVLGGKGGVGKSTIAVNLALTLSAMGVGVGLLDADLNGPDVPHMLGISPGPRPMRQRWRHFEQSARTRRDRPQERYGVEVVSIGFEVPERLPPVISSRWLVSNLLKSFIFHTDWSADVVLIDAPPGTGEELQAMARELPLSGAIFVTTPQDLAQMDAERTLTLMQQNGVPVIGVVQNMAALTCPHCEQEIDMYGESPRLRDAGLTVLGRIPFDVRLSVTADEGRPLVLGDPRGPIAYEFARIGTAVRRWLNTRDEAAG
jgi:ATP-binding protein involved in chromosome partitioning